MLKYPRATAALSVSAITVFLIWFLRPLPVDEIALEKAAAEPSNLDVSSASRSIPLVKTITPNKIAALVAEADSSSVGFEQFIARKPNSLSDVPSPTALGIDQDGVLIIDMRVRNLFEHYLSAMGEEGVDSVILRIKHDLSSQLEGAALDEGLALMEGYLQYRNHLGILKNDFALNHVGSQYDLDAVREMKRVVRQARHSFFSESAIDGMFTQEDEYDDYMMARASVMANPSLSAAQKAEYVNNINAEAPSWIVQSYVSSQTLDRVRSESERVRNDGGDESDVFELRQNTYGAEAAERMRVLDETRALWRSRVEAYRVELDSLLAGSNINALDHDTLSKLRAQYFDGPELQRIAAVDKIELAKH